MSDLSKVFELDNILALSEYITAFEWQGHEEENDYPFLDSDFSFLKLRSCMFWRSRFRCDYKK